VKFGAFVVPHACVVVLHGATWCYMASNHRLD